MKQYMLLFSLGPVQSFIAQARKTRDLWLGSFLLSALMEAGMEGIEESALVFPADPTIRKNIPDLPNKYIAIFKNSDDAKETAKRSQEKIEKYWKGISDDVWSKVVEDPARFSMAITRPIWDRQTESANFFEIFWVVVEGEPENYKQWLQDTQAALDGRKHLRDFKQQEEPGEKGTISGEREALRGTGELRLDVQTFWYEVAKGLHAKDITKDGTERLDAIDTVKRFAYLSRRFNGRSLEAGFPSTSSVATATFIEKLIASREDPFLSSAVQQWLDETDKLNEKVPVAIPFLEKQAKMHERGSEILERDGDCYFPETFTAYHLEKDYGFGKDRKVERDILEVNCTKALLKLLRVAETLSPPITRPTPYYAMIQMDGDRMGVLLSGVKDQPEHKAISQALSTFSQVQALDIVEKRYPGRLIYAGGDDVFALAPLARDYNQEDANSISELPAIKTVLELVNQLQGEYCKTVKQVIRDDLQLSKDTGSQESTASPSRQEQVTASIGIAIAHHYTSLSFVRRASKAAEKLAKDHYGRNALVVTVIRRSGEQTQVGCHWEYPDLANEAQPIALFSYFYRLFREDILSPKCVYHLLEEAPVLVGFGQDAQISEIKRVLRRQRNERLKQKFSKDEAQRKAEHIVALAEAMDIDKRRPKSEKQMLSVELHSDKRRYGLVEVLGWLLVMVFLARKEQD